MSLHVAESIISNYLIWSNSTGLVYRPRTKSWRAAGGRNVPAGPALWARGEFLLCSFLWWRQHAKRCFQPDSPWYPMISWSWYRGCFLTLKQFTDTLVGTAVDFVLFIVLLMKCLFVWVQVLREETSNLSCLCWHCLICSLNTSRGCTEILWVVKCLIPCLAHWEELVRNPTD